ncbi:hypothetical protein [Streptomyces sp. NBC_01214]|uniref:hypothetical protein n=1 Tax=Streptomyces sp. NBC_01214 TaxID=2903777 RepID=UPI00338E59EB
MLGADHPDTLTTRHDLAHWRGQAGDADGAAAALAELLADRMRVLGPDRPPPHPHHPTQPRPLAGRGRRQGQCSVITSPSRSTRGPGPRRRMALAPSTTARMRSGQGASRGSMLPRAVGSSRPPASGPM